MNECVYCLPQMSMMEDPTENAEEESEDELNLKRYILYTCIYNTTCFNMSSNVPCFLSNYFQIEVSIKCL